MTLTRQGLRRLDDPKELRQRKKRRGPPGGVCSCRRCGGTGVVDVWMGGDRAPQDCRECGGYGRVERLTGRPWKAPDPELPPTPKFSHPLD